MQVRIKKIRLTARQTGEIAVVVLSVLLFAWSAYLLFFSVPDEEHELLKVLIQKKTQTVVAQIDTKILQSDDWKQLLQMSVSDAEEVETGRANPFLPPADESLGEGGENR